MKRNIKKNLGTWLSVVFVVLIALACGTIKETYNEFVIEGETIYVGKADSVLVGEGFNKLRFWVVINADPKITKGILKTTDESILHEFEVNRSKSGKDTITFDLEIEEGEYTFGLFLVDDNGNQSVRTEVPATVYGEKYKSGLVNRSISHIDAFAGETVIHWTSASESVLKTVVTYEDSEGNMQEINVPNEESETTLVDNKRGGELQVVSLFRPTATAIEDFEGSPITASFPEEADAYLVNKSKITVLSLTGDASAGCWGSNYGRLFDGSTSTGFWHSCNTPSDLYPWVLSFDLGSEVELVQFDLDERGDCCGDRSPGHFQIWATNDITDAITGDIDEGSLEEWEAEAMSKGWVKLHEVKENTEYSFEESFSTDGTKYRYVRFVGISSIGGGGEANFNELTFWGK